MSFTLEFKVDDITQTIVVLEKIGSGAYGVVYKAILSGYGEIALKEHIKGDVADILSSLHTEIRIGQMDLKRSKSAKKILIPKMYLFYAQQAFGDLYKDYVRVIESNQHSIFTIYDLVNGLTLQEYEKRFRHVYSAPEIVNQNIKSLLLAIDELHDIEVAHCDIKPANVMLDHGTIVLIDMGLACFVEECSGHRGSINYMAFEIFADDVTDWKKVDVFSAASLIYFILCKVPLLTAAIPRVKTAADFRLTVRQRKEKTRAEFKAAISKIPPEFAAYIPLLEKMSDPDPIVRFSIGECIDFFNSNIAPGLVDDE